MPRPAKIPRFDEQRSVALCRDHKPIVVLTIGSGQMIVSIKKTGE